MKTLDGYFIDQGTHFYVVSTLPDQYMIRWLSKQKDVSGLEVADGCIQFIGRVRKKFGLQTPFQIPCFSECKIGSHI